MPSTRAFEAYLLVYVYIRCFAAFSKKRKKEEEEEEQRRRTTKRMQGGEWKEKPSLLRTADREGSALTPNGRISI